MKHFYLCIIALLSTFGAYCQEPVWHSGSEFPLCGKINDSTLTRYERLPAFLKGVSREDIWYLGTHSSGLFLRFASNSPSIKARWKVRYNNHMPHMTDVGSKGMDMYTLLDGKWRYVGSAVPSWDGTTPSESYILQHGDAKMREYMLYLPLYDNLESLELGVEQDCIIQPPLQQTALTGNRPVVMYGTSILQGACASRPGMAHTNILSRRLDRIVYNLGFSGNAMLDMEIAHLMASVPDPAVFVLDYAPNAWDYLIDEKGEEFFRIVRDAHPDVPVIFVEDVTFPHYIFDSHIHEEVDKKNAAQRRLYEKLRKEGVKQIYYVTSDRLCGSDGEASVEAIHFTDLGMLRYADALCPVIQKAIRRSGKGRR